MPVTRAVRLHGTCHATTPTPTGLTPKRYSRVARFRQSLVRLGTQPALSRAELALASGYCDQPHFTREFKAMTGLSPGEYLRSAPAGHHVPVRWASRS